MGQVEDPKAQNPISPQTYLSQNLKNNLLPGPNKPTTKPAPNRSDLEQVTG